MYVSRCIGVCRDQNRTVRDHNAQRWDERLQDLLPHPHLPCEPSWTFRLIPDRYKTLSHRGPLAAAEGSTYCWTISPASPACHRACVAVSMPLWLLALSRRMIDFVPWREVAQAAPLGSRRRAQHLTQSGEGSYELLSNPNFFSQKTAITGIFGPIVCANPITVKQEEAK